MFDSIKTILEILSLSLSLFLFLSLDASKRYKLRENPPRRKYSTNWLTDPVFLEYIGSKNYNVIIFYYIRSLQLKTKKRRKTKKTFYLISCRIINTVKAFLQKKGMVTFLCEFTVKVDFIVVC